MGLIKCFNIHKQGASHLKGNKVCQDFSGSYSCDEASSLKYYIIAISDGHGGNKYFRSDIGSQKAVEMAITCIHNCMLTSEFVAALQSVTLPQNKKEEYIVNVEESVIAKWNDIIQSHIADNDFTDDELAHIDKEHKARMLDVTSDYRYKAYGATLVVAVVSEDFWFGFQIGDGTFVVKQDGKYSQPIELDPKCVGVNVTSICDINAIKYFHHDWGYGIPEAVFVASDGVDESFASVEGLYKFYDNIIKNSSDDWNDNVRELESYLPELSAKGSRDDVALAAIVNLDKRSAIHDKKISEANSSIATNAVTESGIND